VIRVAGAGHRNLPPATAELVRAAIRAELSPVAPEVVGISFLADGADTIFARTVLDVGGTIEAVVPAARYREGLPTDHQPVYDELLDRAVTVHRRDAIWSTPEAHMEASKFMIGLSDELLAVWDGQPARGYGGTADIVAYARSLGVPVRLIWPAGSRRS
jgi:hypothetical protein